MASIIARFLIGLLVILVSVAGCTAGESTDNNACRPCVNRNVGAEGSPEKTTECTPGGSGNGLTYCNCHTDLDQIKLMYLYNGGCEG